jgi:hypothetical protein
MISCAWRGRLGIVSPNRWLLPLTEPPATHVILLVQAPLLVSSSHVQDLAEVVRARGLQRGILLAYRGVFTPDAQRTAIERADERLHRCTTLPQAALGSAKGVNQGG